MHETEVIRSHIKSLEAQFRVLKAQIESSPTRPKKPGYSFADLYGRLQGQVESSEDEINTVLYQLSNDPEAKS